MGDDRAGAVLTGAHGRNDPHPKSFRRVKAVVDEADMLRTAEGDHMPETGAEEEANGGDWFVFVASQSGLTDLLWVKAD